MRPFKIGREGKNIYYSKKYFPGCINLMALGCNQNKKSPNTGPFTMLLCD